MKLEEVIGLMNHFDKTGLTELDLTMENVHVSIKKNSHTSSETTSLESTIVHSQAVEELEEIEELLCVKAPIVGTFYTAPSPNDPPFVKVGDKVKKGDTIGLIEAMKIMNEIPSPVDGTVMEIIAKDSSLVSFEEPLLRIKEN